jgi:hypothetical protein
MAGARLDQLAREAQALADNPPPLVSQGKIMYDEVTGEPYRDGGVRAQALELKRKVEADIRKFEGLDAPKRSVTAHIEVADVKARLAELRSELGIEGEDPPVLAGAVLEPGGLGQ